MKVYLGVGSNLGDRKSYLEQAQFLVAKLPETQFLRSSSIRETDPVGGPPQGKYLNAVWEIETSLAPRELKNRLRGIEGRLGRKAAEPNSPRQIDLDILFYGDQIVEESDLHIPHRRLHERDFVLEPLAELVPHWVHPRMKLSVKELLEQTRRGGVIPPSDAGRGDRAPTSCL